MMALAGGLCPNRGRGLRGLWGTALFALAHWGLASAGALPEGRLPDMVIPQAYRLSLTVDPAAARFSGHTEIDVILKQSTRQLYLHGQDLAMTAAKARLAGHDQVAHYTQLDSFGLARLQFPHPLPAGKLTLVFDYSAPFNTSAAGLFHLEVGGQWYAWTQFGSIAARSAFPGFDQPGYKSPFTVTLTTPAGLVVYANTEETGSTPKGNRVEHQFAPTRPLPNYLVAFGVGPFAVVSAQIPPTPQRAQPLPLRVIATQANRDKLEFALHNTGPIVALLEDFFGQPFPFSKLDQVATPMLEGAMENAGAVTYNDQVLIRDPDGDSAADQQYFGATVAHELAHQWFGDLVTPEWWDDLWLNESFAEWLAYRVADRWRPGLHIGSEAIGGSLHAMTLDSLKAGRPMHTSIQHSGEIDSAFDGIIYGKGAQVLSMMAGYLGQDTFREAVRQHLSRHAYGTATTEDFFTALAQAAHDPRIVTALKSFVYQQGVPLVQIERQANTLQLTQRRFTLLGSVAPAQVWTIPVCLREGTQRQCLLLHQPQGRVPSQGGGVILPNVGGAGYYRFSLSEADWRALVADSAQLPPVEALAMTDSLWADFRRGELAPALLLTGAQAMVANPSSAAVVQVGQELAGLRAHGLIGASALPAYRRFIQSLYAPLLERLGFDPHAHRYDQEDPDQQKLRYAAAGFLALEARDESVRRRLFTATHAWLQGDRAALDSGLIDAGITTYLTSADLPAVQALFEHALAGDDSALRRAVTQGLAQSADAKLGAWVIGRFDDPRLHARDKSYMLRELMAEAATREVALGWLVSHFDDLADHGDIFTVPILLRSPGEFCSVAKAQEIDAAFRPKVIAHHRDLLPLDRTVEQVHACGLLLEQRGAQLSQALEASSRAAP